MTSISESLDCLNIEINVVGNRYQKPRKLSPEELARLQAQRRGANRPPSKDDPSPPPEQSEKGQ